MADPALFLATLNVAAIHLDLLQRQPSNPRTLARKGETIRLINEKLTDSTQALTNETVSVPSLLEKNEN